MAGLTLRQATKHRELVLVVLLHLASVPFPIGLLEIALWANPMSKARFDECIGFVKKLVPKFDTLRHWQVVDARRGGVGRRDEGGHGIGKLHRNSEK